MAELFHWETGRTLVMGILNVTPDSFSDGGQFLDPAAAVARAHDLHAAGADILDIGGESSRPGSLPVSAEEELRRVIPVVESLPGRLISIDTTKAVVAHAAVRAGARIINDISAGRFDPGMFEVARETGAGLVLMHMQATPATMQQAPRYADPVREVRDFLADRVSAAERAGVKKCQIAVDPGIGFGKSAADNLRLLAEIAELQGLGCPILVGASRKSFIGHTLARQASERLPGSLAAAAWAVVHGAQIVRVHDVAATVDMVRLIAAIQQSAGAHGHRI